jgi:hypothetical protein
MCEMQDSMCDMCIYAELLSKLCERVPAFRLEMRKTNQVRFYDEIDGEIGRF